jgi:hypothetical protein
VRIRRWVAGKLHGIRGGPAATGPVATFVRAHLRGLRIGLVAVAVLTFVFMTQPTGVTIIVIAALLLVALAILEFLGRPEVPAAEPQDDASTTRPEDDARTAAPPTASAPGPAPVPPAPREGQDVVAPR